MKTGNPQKPTDAELAILQVMWRRGAATVREVHTELSKEKSAGYTTILKLMQIMHEKGLLVREETARAHRYAAAETEQQSQRRLLDDLLRKAFGGSAQRLVVQALSDRTASQQEIEAIRQLLDEMEAKGR